MGASCLSQRVTLRKEDLKERTDDEVERINIMPKLTTKMIRKLNTSKKAMKSASYKLSRSKKRKKKICERQLLQKRKDKQRQFKLENWNLSKKKLQNKHKIFKMQMLDKEEPKRSNRLPKLKNWPKLKELQNKLNLVKNYKMKFWLKS